MNSVTQCSEVVNPPQSAAGGCEAGNLNTSHVMGMGHVLGLQRPGQLMQCRPLFPRPRPILPVQESR